MKDYENKSIRDGVWSSTTWVQQSRIQHQFLKMLVKYSQTYNEMQRVTPLNITLARAFYQPFMPV